MEQVLIRAEIIGENASGQKHIRLLANNADGIHFWTDDKSIVRSIEPDTDTISRQDAINLIEQYCDNGCEISEYKWCPDCQQSKFAEMIKALPPSPSNLTDKEKDFLLDCLYKTDWTYRAVADTIIKKLHLVP